MNELQASRATLKLDVKEIRAPEQSQMVMAHVGTSAWFPEEAKDDDEYVDWNYFGEFNFVFEMSEAGDRIRRVLDVLDSKNSEMLLVLADRARRNLAAKKP